MYCSTPFKNRRNKKQSSTGEMTQLADSVGNVMKSHGSGRVGSGQVGLRGFQTFTDQVGPPSLDYTRPEPRVLTRSLDSREKDTSTQLFLTQSDTWVERAGFLIGDKMGLFLCC